ncbi:MAG: DUF1287 domain-containing protein [Parvularculaceae bacterium]
MFRAALIFSSPPRRFAAPEDFGARLSAAAIERTGRSVAYDAAYRRIAYPMGDVAPDRGVCADVVIRALRALDMDLQQLVHEDMTANFSAYPQLWGLARADSNIDHRRVPNLETFMTRKGWRLRPSLDARDYRPGDIVAWNLRGEAGFLPHIGIVTDRIGASGWPMVVHNIGAGPKLEDALFSWPMTGRYRIEIAPRAAP